MKQILKYLYKILLFYSPDTVKNKLYQFQSNLEVKKGRKIAKNNTVTKENVVEILKSLDLSGDILLHTSITNLGKIKGGAKFICEVLLSNIDLENNTLLVSALPYRGLFYEYLKTNPVFDVRNAPIAMGTVNERLAKMPGSKRSLHPTHSIVAIGKEAQCYISNHHKDNTPFGEHSPYKKILFKGGSKILLIGATLNNVTAVHALEDLLGSDYIKDIYSDKIYSVSCIDWDGKPLIVKTKCHHPLKCMKRDMERMRKYLTELGAIEQHRVGGGFITLLDCDKFVVAFFKMLQQGENIYGHHHVTDNLLKAIDKINNLYKKV